MKIFSYLLNLGLVTVTFASQQTAPAATKSGDPAATQSGAPAATQSGAPAATKSGAPAATQSGAPAATKSGDPAATKSGDPAAAKSGDPAAAKSGAPAATQSGAPAATQSGAPAATQSGAPAADPKSVTENPNDDHLTKSRRFIASSIKHNCEKDLNASGDLPCKDPAGVKYTFSIKKQEENTKKAVEGSIAQPNTRQTFGIVNK